MAVLNYGDTVVVASHNQGKLKEIAALLEPYGLKALSARDLNLEEPEETGETFADNAVLKARAAALETGHFALADDSGLEVKALNGAPGIYSARWAGESKDFNHAMGRIATILEEMGLHDPAQRQANFTCALALVSPKGDVHIFEGYVHGEIVWPMRGEQGFGYDPFFQPIGHTDTFGEMDPTAKHAMSHRAEAFAKFKNACLVSS